MPLHFIRFEEGVGLVQISPHHQCGDRKHRAYRKRYPPAPILQLIRCQQEPLKDEQNDDRAELPADQRHVLEARVETAILLVGHLTQVSRARTVFASEAEALDHARKTEQYRRSGPDHCIRRHYRDHQRTETHQKDGEHERVAPSVMIAEMSEKPAADRPDNEAQREQQRRVQLLDDGIVAWEKRTGEVQREGGVHVEVVPFDEVPDRSEKYRLDPAAHVRKVDTVVFGVDYRSGHTSTL